MLYIPCQVGYFRRNTGTNQVDSYSDAPIRHKVSPMQTLCHREEFSASEAAHVRCSFLFSCIVAKSKAERAVPLNVQEKFFDVRRVNTLKVRPF